MAEGGHNGHSQMPMSQFNRYPPPPGATQDNRALCKKFMWGICNKYSRCKFRHEFVFEKMKAILNFCHIFQNKGICDRPDCTYLHATRQEESDFKTSGVIPPALAQRYSDMFAAAPPGERIDGAYMSGLPPPPPPPPPPPLPVPPLPLPVPPPVTVAAAPPPPPPVASSVPHLLPASGGPPSSPVTSGPPPPPVTSAPHSSFGTSAPTAIASSAARPTAPPHHATVPPPIPPPAPVHFHHHYPGPFNGSNALSPHYSMNHQIPSTSVHNMPKFDASKPPPPLHTSSKPEHCAGGKRKLQSAFEAGASKQAKSSGQSDVCKKCIQLRERIGEYKKIIEDMISLEADRNLHYTSRLEEYNRKKTLVLSLVNVDKRREIARFIEGDNVIPESSNGMNLNNTPNSDFATVPKKILTDLMQLVVDNRTAPVGSPSSSVYPGRISSSSDLAPLRICAPSKTVTSENMNTMLNAVTKILAGSNQTPRPTLQVNNFADSRALSNGNVSTTSAGHSALPPVLQPPPPPPHHRPPPRHGPPPITAPPPPPGGQPPARYVFRHPPPTTDVTQPPPPYFDMAYYRKYK